MLRRWVFLSLFICIGLVQIPFVSAHGYILRSIPADRSTLERPPTRLQYWFSEGLEPQFSEIKLRNQAGEILAEGGVDPDNPSLLSLQVPSDLGEGAYIVELRPAFASDGHVVAESRVFFVGETVGNVTGVAASDQAEPFEVIWRTMVMGSALFLFGTVLLYSTVLVPAWGNTKYEAGLLPPRVMRRLNWCFGGGLFIFLLGNLLALLQQSMVFFNATPNQVFSQNLWQVVQIGSRFGDIWNLRMAFTVISIVLFIASIYYRNSAPRAVRAFWVAQAWVLAIILATFTMNSHAAGTLVMPWFGILIDWLHTVAVAYWVGSVAAFVLVLPVALRPYHGEAKRQALLAATSRLSTALVGVVVLVIATGIYSALNWFYTPSDLATSYGSSLAVKLILIALLLAVGAVHHLALRPNLLQALQQQAILRRMIEFGKQFQTSLRIEAVLILLVMVSVGWLTATPIPEPAFTQDQQQSPTATQFVGDYEISTSIIPGGPGVNTYDTVVMYDNEIVSDATVQIQLVNPGDDRRSGWLSTEVVDEQLYVAAGTELYEHGDWVTLVDITDSTGETTRAAFAFDIEQGSAIYDVRDPSILNILAFLLVLFAIGFVLRSQLRWVYERLDLQPANLLAAFLAVVVSFVALFLAAQLINDQQARYEARIYPPPNIVNTVLPTQESINLGEVLFGEHCQSWQEHEDSWEALQAQTSVTRDDALYAAFVAGWRDLPGCTSSLAETERWHIVNYWRSLQSLNRNTV